MPSGSHTVLHPLDYRAYGYVNLPLLCFMTDNAVTGQTLIAEKGTP